MILRVGYAFVVRFTIRHGGTQRRERDKEREQRDIQMDLSTDGIGIVIGTAVFMIFGLLIAFGLPKVFMKDETELSKENLLVIKWIKWLGLTLVFFGAIIIIALLFLP
ncbi:MAG: hypothetical protein J4G05_09615 [Chlorobi bacterium]|nr:hypothetical protein [Chlorobiota bacterium]